MQLEIVGVAGPSGSGKSTLSSYIAKQLRSPCKPIEMDYFFNRAHNNSPAVQTWELPQGIFSSEYAVALKSLRTRLERVLNGSDTGLSGTSLFEIDIPQRPSSRVPQNNVIGDVEGNQWAVNFATDEWMQACDLSSSENCRTILGEQFSIEGQETAHDDLTTKSKTVYLVVEGFLLAYFPEVLQQCSKIVTLFGISPELSSVRRFLRDTGRSQEEKIASLAELGKANPLNRRKVNEFIRNKINEVYIACGEEDDKRDFNSLTSDEANRRTEELRQGKELDLTLRQKLQARYAPPRLWGPSPAQLHEADNQQVCPLVGRARAQPFDVISEELLNYVLGEQVEFGGDDHSPESSAATSQQLSQPPLKLDKESREHITMLVNEYLEFRRWFYRTVWFFYETFRPTQERNISDRCGSNDASSSKCTWFSVDPLSLSQLDSSGNFDQKQTSLDESARNLVERLTDHSESDFKARILSRK